MISSSVSFTPTALTALSTCSIFVAPTIALETAGRERSHARDTSAHETFFLAAATAFALSTTSQSQSWKYISCAKVSDLARVVSCAAGAPRLRVPARKPRARGLLYKEKTSHFERLLLLPLLCSLLLLRLSRSFRCCSIQCSFGWLCLTVTLSFSLSPWNDTDSLIATQRHHLPKRTDTLRTEDQSSVTLLLPLFLTIDKVVVVLHADKLCPAVLLRDRERLHELPRVAARAADIADLPTANQIVQSLCRNYNEKESFSYLVTWFIFAQREREKWSDKHTKEQVFCLSLLTPSLSQARSYCFLSS